MKKGMPLTPLMYPESYPKKIPPNAAKAHIKYAFQVMGASMRSISLVADTSASLSPAMTVDVGGCYN